MKPESRLWMSRLAEAIVDNSLTDEQRANAKGIHDAATALFTHIEALPETEYRDSALCRLNDTLIFAHIAARQ